MLHEGGPGNSVWFCQCKRLTRLACKVCRLQFALIGFLKNLALHLGPSPSIHSYGYGFNSGHPALSPPRGQCCALLKSAPGEFVGRYSKLLSQLPQKFRFLHPTCRLGQRMARAAPGFRHVSAVQGGSAYPAHQADPGMSSPYLARSPARSGNSRSSPAMYAP